MNAARKNACDVPYTASLAGHLQFVGGGWTQNDEAVTHYTAIIDQMTLGLRFLNDTFGHECGVPSVAWQADPFGHSAAQAALFAKMGFSGLMVGRVSWDMLAEWKKTEHMGFIWKMVPQEAEETYEVSDRLLARANVIASGFMHVLRWLLKGTKPVNVVYSTPACYLEACKQLSVLGAVSKESKVRSLQEALAVMQHHDAITGTSSSYVAEDYAAILSKGIAGCEEVLDEALSAHPASSDSAMDSPHGKQPRMLRFCHLLNQSQCTASESQREFTVIVYNPSSVDVTPYLRLPVNPLRSSEFFIGGPGAKVVEYQVTPVPPLRNEQFGHVLTNSTATLVFRAQVSALGYSAYRVAYALTPTVPPPGSFLELERPSTFIENKRYRVEIDPNSGLVARVVLLGARPDSVTTGKHARGRSGSAPTVHLRQTFVAYKNNEETPYPPPGHYVFGAYREAENLGEKVVHRVVKGQLVQELHQVFNDYVSQVVTLHQNSDVIEFTWTVGPTPFFQHPLQGLDVASRYETDLNSQGFYTDGNGWRNMHRV
ncbi:lysosomal alpha-mannosidase-like [Haemaphysalis longicornis]